MRKMLLFILLSLLSVHAKADFDPIDIINWLKAMYGIQSDSLPDIKTNTRDTAELLRENLNGHHGFGNLHNDMNERLWSADSWDDALKGGGGQTAQKFKAAQDNYARIYPVKKSDAIAKSLPQNSLTEAHYQQSQAISRTALAASNVSYSSINDHIKKVNDILLKLETDEAKTEKGALDLNTRLVAELSFIQLDMLKLQNIQAQLSATQLQGNVNGVSDQTTFLNTKEHTP